MFATMLSILNRCFNLFAFFFFNDTATTEIYTLSLHDALPISRKPRQRAPPRRARPARPGPPRDRKSTRLNSSHVKISYAVFSLKKKKVLSRGFVLHHTHSTIFRLRTVATLC